MKLVSHCPKNGHYKQPSPPLCSPILTILTHSLASASVFFSAVPASELNSSCRGVCHFFCLHIFLIFWNFPLTTAEEKQNSEPEMKRNACERVQKRRVDIGLLFWFCWHSWKIKCFLKESHNAKEWSVKRAQRVQDWAVSTALPVGYWMTLHTPFCLSFSEFKITAMILTSWNASLPQYLLMKNTIRRAEHNYYQFLSRLL